MPTSEAKKKAVKAYCQKQVGFSFRLRPDADADVIAWIRAQPSLTEAIRTMVRREIASGSDTQGAEQAPKLRADGNQEPSLPGARESAS